MLRGSTSHTLLRNVTAGSAWGVLPLKNPEQAKTRLAPVLRPEERRKLFRIMAEDVLAALSGAEGLAGTVVVTRDPWAQALAEKYGAAILEESQNRGQSPAVRDAAAALARAGAGAALALPGDVPLVSPAEIHRVLAAHGPAPAVTLTPAADGRGDQLRGLLAARRHCVLFRPRQLRAAQGRSAGSRRRAAYRHGGCPASPSMWTSPGICACCLRRVAPVGRSNG